MRSVVFLAVSMALLVACGPGRPSGTCGLGTTETAGVCVATGVCGTGTHEQAGVCVADNSCGAGTTLVGTQCVGVGSVLCGAGTVFDGTQCVSTTLTCGAGTVKQGNQCVPSGSAVSCGSGTVLQGGQCVPSGAAITCGPGTVQQGSQCIASGATVTCGAGTTLQGNQCVAFSGLTCGAGTTQSGGQCVAVSSGSGNYVLRAPLTVVPADGYSKVPVFALGTMPGGGASTEAVVVTVSPSYAGTVSPATFNLGALGTTLYFTPCSATSPACSGTFTIDLALASAPSVVVASTGTLSLVPPQGVGSAAVCLLGGNTVFFDGDSGDYIFPSTATITQGTWSASGGARYVSIHVTPSDSQQGLWWDLDFSTQQLGQDMTTTVYTQAERAPFAAPGHPGIDIGGDGRGCNTISGSFQVHSITWQGATLRDFTASFEQHCEGGAAALRGCVHFAQ